MLCVIAKIPDGAADQLRALRETAVPDPGALFPLYAHITIATWLPEDSAAFMRNCRKLLQECRPFTVRYERIEVLPETSVIVAAPAESAALRLLHDRIAEEYAGSLDQWTGTCQWYPHTTLLYDPAADLDAVCQAMRRHFVPFEARISRIEFSKVEETGFTIIDAVQLPDGSAGNKK